MKLYEHSIACAIFDERDGEGSRPCTCTPPSVCTHGIVRPESCYWCANQFKLEEPLPTEGGRC